MSSKTPSQFANVNPNVFFSTVIIIAIFLAIVIIAPSSFEFLTQQLKQWITDSFSWFYVLSVAVFLILLIYIACSDSGKIGGVSKSMLKQSRLNFDKIEKCK